MVFLQSIPPGDSCGIFPVICPSQGPDTETAYVDWISHQTDKTIRRDQHTHKAKRKRGKSQCAVRAKTSTITQ